MGLIRLGGGTSLTLPRGYIDGLNIGNGPVDTQHDIQFGAGACRGANNNENIIETVGSIKQIDAAWAAGNNAGGLFTGSVAADTWYHAFAIKNDSGGAAEFGFDTNVNAGNRPAGYTPFRRLGSVLTDGSSNLLGFTQFWNYFLWDDPPQDIDDSTLGTSAQLYTLSVPIDVVVFPWCNVRAAKSGSVVAIYLSSPFADDEAPQRTNGAPLTTLRAWDNSGGGVIHKTRFMTNASAQIRARSDETSTILRVATLGWEDPRGVF